MARRFFYVAAGMFLLALSYHLGAGTATAQAPGAVECVLFTEGSAFAVVNHRLIVIENNGAYHDYGALPMPGRAIACSGNGAVMDDGSVWHFFTVAGVWERFGQLPVGAPTPAARESWGQVKARYRTPAGGSVTPGADNR